MVSYIRRYIERQSGATPASGEVQIASNAVRRPVARPDLVETFPSRD
jgi:hypothetical protein